MKKSYFFTVLLILFASANLLAQKKMQPAKIINNLGKSESGFIRYTSNASLCEKILFSATPTTKPKVYYPKSINSFELTELNRKFIYATIAVDSTKEDTVFLETIIHLDDKKLHSHQAKSGKKRFFLESNKIGLKELIEENTTVKLNGSTYTKKNKKFIGLLKLTFKNCDLLNDAYFEKVSLNIIPLEKVFETYAECSKKKISYKSSYNLKKGALNFLFGIGFSYALTSSSFPSTFSAQSYLQNPKGVLGVPISLGLSFYPPRLRNTFFMGIGCAYQQKGAMAEVNNTKFNLHFLSPYINFGYQYPFGKIKPFLGVDFSSGFLLNPNDAFTRTHPFSGDLQYLFYDRNSYDGSAMEMGIGVFAGVDIPVSKHAVRIELKYIHGRLPFLNPFYGTNYLQIQAQFRFNTKR